MSLQEGPCSGIAGPPRRGRTSARADAARRQRLLPGACRVPRSGLPPALSTLASASASASALAPAPTTSPPGRPSHLPKRAWHSPSGSDSQAGSVRKFLKFVGGKDRAKDNSPSVSPTKGNAQKSPTGQRGQPAHWSQSLRDAMDDPSAQIFFDDQAVVIPDKFPQARHHRPVLPWRFVANVGVLRADHLPLQRDVHDVAERLSRKVQPLGAATAPPASRLGYHAVPSMSRIHMHIISQDFGSPRLKTKRHWNSFTTGYFIDSEDGRLRRALPAAAGGAICEGAE
uniref:Aprataxin-like n=1 Tax=Petromyzon marinus TaxID=7757 RepID=A0AAJ7SIS9_PETMA